MSLTAADRIGRGDATLPAARRAGVLGASVALHGAVLLAMLALGHRLTTPPEPPTLEMMFEAPQTEPATLEVAETTPAPAPTVSAPEVVTASTPEITHPADAPTVASTVAPAETAMARVPETAKSMPDAATASVPDAEPPQALAPAAPVSVTVAPEAELPVAEPAPVAEAHAVPSVRRVVPARVAARAMPERRSTRASETPLPAVASFSPAPVAAGLGTPVAMVAPPPVRTVSISNRWQAELASWIRSRTRYPEEAKQRGEQGAVLISFTVGRDGQVLDARLRQASGSETLDQAAMAMFRSARVPAFPPDMDAPQVTISVPVRYRLEQ